MRSINWEGLGGVERVAGGFDFLLLILSPVFFLFLFAGFVATTTTFVVTILFILSPDFVTAFYIILPPVLFKFLCNVHNSVESNCQVSLAVRLSRYRA